jgi:hypothetical protein
MRSRIATCFGVAAILSACGGGDSPGGGPAIVNAPSPTTGGAGSSAMAAPPSAQTTPSSMVPTASNPTTPPTASTTPPPAAMPPAQMPAAMPPVTPPAQMPPAGGPVKLAMDECGLNTKWNGDEFCINAPAAADGFQMHIGPSNYDSPEPQFLLQPGDEVTENFNATSGNDKDVYYYWRQYRMRPGSHHLIVNAGARRIGGSSNAAKDNPEAGVIAPENVGVGMPLKARTAISNSLHYFNFTEKPVIKEVWVNFHYRDASLVKSPTNEVFSMVGMNIAPGQHVNKHGACTVSQAGRVLTIYGHVHSHNERFSVWRTRGGNKQLVHEAYDWEHPNVSEFSSTVMNPALDAKAKKDGGFSGVLDLMPGDQLEFECQILNDTNTVFVGANEANDDEMCIMIGDTVGTAISPLCTQSDIPVAN